MSFKATGAGASPEPTLHCPNCNHEIRLTESLAAPLLAETRQRFQEQLASKDAEIERKTDALRLEREQLVKDREQNRRPSCEAIDRRTRSDGCGRKQEGARGGRWRAAGEGSGSCRPARHPTYQQG